MKLPEGRRNDMRGDYGILRWYAAFILCAVKHTTSKLLAFCDVQFHRSLAIQMLCCENRKYLETVSAFDHPPARIIAARS